MILRLHWAVNSFGEKREFLSHHYVPPPNFKFHAVLQANRNRGVQRHWLEKDAGVLAFSQQEHGFFCAVCAVFTHELTGVVKGSHQEMGNFVKKPFRRFKDFTECWKIHKRSEYHRIAVERAAAFKQSLESGLSVIDIATEGSREQKRKGKKRLEAVTQAIIWLVTNELPFRGSTDFGKIGKATRGQGLLRSVIQLMATNGNTQCVELVEGDVPRNATYMSPQIQNEIIGIIGKLTMKKVVDKVVGGFSVLADEAQSHNREFLTVCIRHVNANMEICEEFTGFSRIHDMTGEGIAREIISHLGKLGFDIKMMIAQGFDGAAAMSGAFRGAQKFVRDEVIKAGGNECCYYHCASHRLNLAVSSAASTQPIDRMLNRVKEIIDFFASSAKRADLLENAITAHGANIQKHIRYNPTRWVERYESLDRFRKLMVPTFHALRAADQMERDPKAEDLINGFLWFSTIFSFHISLKVSAMLIQLSTNLQSKKIDLVDVYNSVWTVIGVLNTWKETKFEQTLNDSRETCRLLEVEEILRPNERRMEENAENFAKNRIFVPYLENLIAELTARFEKGQLLVFELEMLIPTKNSKIEQEKFLQVAKIYPLFVEDDPEILKAELERWQKKWETKPENERPGTVQKTLLTFRSEFERGSFPNIFALLKILACTPVTTASAERSFSLMGRLFTKIRSSMGDERLSELAISSYYRELVTADLSINAIIDEFDKDGNRRFHLY